jgi:hypothetical protein
MSFNCFSNYLARRIDLNLNLTLRVQIEKTNEVRGSIWPNLKMGGWVWSNSHEIHVFNGSCWSCFYTRLDLIVRYSETLRLILAVDLSEDNVIFKAAVVDNKKSSGTGVVSCFQGNDFCLCPLRKSWGVIGGHVTICGLYHGPRQFLTGTRI